MNIIFKQVIHNERVIEIAILEDEKNDRFNAINERKLHTAKQATQNVPQIV